MEKLNTSEGTQFTQQARHQVGFSPFVLWVPSRVILMPESVACSLRVRVCSFGDSDEKAERKPSRTGLQEKPHGIPCQPNSIEQSSINAMITVSPYRALSNMIPSLFGLLSSLRTPWERWRMLSRTQLSDTECMTERLQEPVQLHSNCSCAPSKVTLGFFPFWTADF